jgi:hypothetical protein
VGSVFDEKVVGNWVAHKDMNVIFSPTKVEKFDDLLS